MPRRRWGWVAVTLAAMLVPFVVADGPATAMDTATCTDVGNTGGRSGTWVARFIVRSSVYGPMVQVTSLGYRAADGAPTVNHPSSRWKLQWVPLGDAPRPTRWGSDAIIGTPVASYFLPRLVTPNGRCTIYLRPYSFTPDGRRTGIVGDSITYNASKTLMQKAHFARLAYAQGMRLEVDAFPGRTWLSNGRIRATDMVDEIRGLEGVRTRTVVAALGTNDAIYTAGERDSGARHRRRVDTLWALTQGVKETAARSCLVLVTPADYPAAVFGLHERYAREARTIGNRMRYLAGVPHDNIKLLDWAEMSRDHHKPDGTPDDWFPDGDDVHLNGTGQHVYVHALTAAADRCA